MDWLRSTLPEALAGIPDELGAPATTADEEILSFVSLSASVNGSGGDEDSLSTATSPSPSTSLDFGDRAVPEDVIARRAERERRFRAEMMSKSPSLSAESAEASGAPIFDELVVVGVIPSESASQAPKLGVIWQWPEEGRPADSISNIELFCFSGVSERRATREVGRTESLRRGEPSMMELLYSRSVAHDSGRSFAFRVNGGRYGICVTRWEPPNWPVLRDWHGCAQRTMDELLDSCARGLPIPAADGTAIQTCVATQRCYCLVTRRPFFALQFGFLRDLLDHDRFGLISHTCAPSSSPSPSPAAPPPLPSSDFLFAASPQFTLDCLTSSQALLKRYHSVPVPKPGSVLSLLVSPHLGHRRVFERARIDADEEEAELLGLYGGAQLAKRVPPWLLVPLLSAILLELQVVVVCANIRELTGTVLALLGLLRPFRYHGVAIPVLPAKLSAVLDAPVPFLVGMTRRPPLAPFERTLTIADLDRGELVVSAQRFPMIPRSKRLEAALCGPLASLLRELDPSPGPGVPRGSSAALTASEAGLLTADQAKHYMSIAACVRDHLASICPKDALKRSFATFFSDKEPAAGSIKGKELTKESATAAATATAVVAVVAPVTVLVKESFLAAVPADDRPFLVPFAETQIFTSHFEKQLRVMDESHARQQDLCDTFDGLL